MSRQWNYHSELPVINDQAVTNVYYLQIYKCMFVLGLLCVIPILVCKAHGCASPWRDLTVLPFLRHGAYMNLGSKY